jgi:hypothetical protein
LKEADITKMSWPFCVAVTLRVVKEPPSRERSTS